MNATDHMIINMLGFLMGFAVLAVRAILNLSIQVAYLTKYIKRLGELSTKTTNSTVEAHSINDECANPNDNFDQTRKVEKGKSSNH